MKGYSFRSLTDLVLKIFKTKVNAGTGLSGGGSLEADRTLTVNYGTIAGTAAEGNDSRLSDSREWTGATIGQVEAEVGVATTRRAFTAQRVRQAIVAWWNNITGVFGRDLVTSADNTAARDKLGLFTSALRWPTWAEVTSKPTTFTPSSHTHPWSQVTGQPVTATRWPSLAEVTGTPANYPTTWDSVAAKPAQATRWPTFAEVTGRPETYTPSSHTHPWSQVTGQPATATRWPTFAEVTDKPTNYPTDWDNVSNKPIVQTVGTSSSNLMSQKAVTDLFKISAWISRAIGEEIWLDDNNPAVQTPPTNNSSFRYIKLTAGESGIGGYNAGVLTNESVSGSSPRINATAKINLPGSPFHGRVVRLLNTERRFVRAGGAGVVQDDEFKSHSHAGGAINRGALADLGTGTSVMRATNTSATGGEETRPRNIGRTVYMRIL